MLKKQSDPCNKYNSSKLAMKKVISNPKIITIKNYINYKDILQKQIYKN